MVTFRRGSLDLTLGRGTTSDTAPSVSTNDSGKVPRTAQASPAELRGIPAIGPQAAGSAIRGTVPGEGEALDNWPPPSPPPCSSSILRSQSERSSLPTRPQPPWGGVSGGA